jgi:hypothetical protein
MIPATGSRRILQENTGNRWNMKAAFQPKIVRNRQFPDWVVRLGHSADTVSIFFNK